MLIKSTTIDGRLEKKHPTGDSLEALISTSKYSISIFCQLFHSKCSNQACFHETTLKLGARIVIFLCSATSALVASFIKACGRTIPIYRAFFTRKYNYLLKIVAF